MLTNELEHRSSLPCPYRELALLKWQNELERINQEWKQEEDSYMVRGRYGSRSLPASNPAEPLLGITLGIGFTIMGITDWIQTQTFPLAFYGGIGIIAGTLMAFTFAKRKRHKYEEASAEYQQRRTEHLQRKPK